MHYTDQLSFESCREVFVQNYSNKLDDIKSEFNIYKKDDPIFQRLNCKIESNKKELTHNYHFCIDTTNGDLYLDNIRLTLFIKHFFLSFCLPLAMTIKWIWHATIIGPLFYFRNKEDFFKSCKEIFTTPIYTIMLTIVSVAGVILSPFNPNILYRTRKLYGRILANQLKITDYKQIFHLNKNINNIFCKKILDIWQQLIGPCFIPILNITCNFYALKKPSSYKMYHFHTLKDFNDKIFPINEDKDIIDNNLRKCALIEIHLKETERVLFLNCLIKKDLNVSYSTF